MSNVSLVIASPKRALKAVLHADPVQTRPVQLRAFLFDGEDDVTSEAEFSWYVSWRGSYKTYRTNVGTGPSLSLAFTMGGSLLTATAEYEGNRHRASVEMSVAGTNPTAEQVSAAIGNDEVLKALCWQESTWRQFNKRGAPLKNKGSSARGIGQVMEYHWAGNAGIAHSDYHRIAWQWDYCIQAARDILTTYRERVRKRYGNAGEPLITDWTILIYHLGPSKLGDGRDPSLDDYVMKIRTLMAERPWEE